jgi:high-affinity iron transporter
VRIWVVALLAALVAAAPARAADRTPSQAADTVNQRLFDAQTELILSGPAEAVKDARQAESAYEGELRTTLREADPKADEAIETALDDAVAAARKGDRVKLAAARGAARAGLFKGSFTVTVAAAGRGDAKTARAWLLLREFRTATRFTRPGAEGTLAVDQLARGTLSAARAKQAVTKDLLDAYQARLRELLKDVQDGIDKQLPERQAEASAQAEGYFQILAARYREDRGAAAEQAAEQAFAGLPRTLAAANRALEGFTAAPFTAEEAARRAQQLLQFLALVPVEYGRGVKGTHVTRDFEITEAVAFRTGADGALADLKDQLAKRNQAKTDAGAAALAELGKQVEFANKNKDGVATHEQV